MELCERKTIQNFLSSKMENYFKHIYSIELDEDFVVPFFTSRKKRILADLSITLSCLRHDAPKVIIKKTQKYNNIIVVEFVKDQGTIWDSKLSFMCEKTGIEFYETEKGEYISYVLIPKNNIHEFKETVKYFFKKLIEEMEKTCWDGKKIARMDYINRQLELMQDDEFIKQLNIIAQF